MGTYLYEQTTKKIKIIRPDFGVITVNEIKYYCKPYWDLWNGSTPYGEQEKQIAADYRRKQAVAGKRTPNRYVAREDNDGSYLVYQWDSERPPIIFSDDDNFGTHLKRLGRATKTGRSWYLDETPPSPKALKGGRP